jgi:PAS domain-containing protein
MAMPIPPMGGAGLAGFLILGLTERRPYDDGYRLFLRLLSDRLLNSTAQVSLPKDMRDAQVAAEEAALRHATLSQQLALKSQEADRNEAKVSRMAQQAPVGIVVLDVDFNPVDINETARLIVGSPDDSDGSWDDMIHDEDREMVWQELQECRKSRVTRTFQYRLKKPWTSFQDGVEINGSTWINAMLFAEVEDGELVGITCWCMDISLQKWTEESQARRLEEAMELKRQRENFIDMSRSCMTTALSCD